MHILFDVIFLYLVMGIVAIEVIWLKATELEKQEFFVDLESDYRGHVDFFGEGFIVEPVWRLAVFIFVVVFWLPLLVLDW